MFSPKTKSLIFKLLLAIFVPDFRTVYRQHLETLNAQQQMKQLLQTVTPTELYEAKLQHIAEQMSDLQKAIYFLYEKGFSHKEIAHNINVPLRKIQRHLDSIEQEVHFLFRYTNTK